MEIKLDKYILLNGIKTVIRGLGVHFADSGCIVLRLW